MIIRRLYSMTNINSLPDSRIGIGWIQEKNDKLRSEKYLKNIKAAADKEYNKGGNDEDILKAARKSGSRSVISDELPVATGKALGAGLLAYGVTKYPDKSIDIFKKSSPNFIKNIEPISRFMKKNHRKLTGAVAAGTLLYNLPGIKKKSDSVKLGAEINTRDRLKKLKKYENTKK